MDLFKPELSLFQQGKDEYTLRSVTLTPNSCYYAGPARVGRPPGVIVLPEVLPVTLEIRRRSGPVCLQVITPVEHALRNLKLGPAQGKHWVTAFAVLDGLVVGSSTIAVATGANESVTAAADTKASAPSCPLGSRDWKAWANEMPGVERSLHVLGQVLAPTPCYEVHLKPAEPQGTNPQQLILDVSLTPIEVPCIEVLTWLDARYDQEPYDGKHDEVAIRCGGEIYAVVPIEIIS